MPHSQARNGIKFISGLQLLDSMMYAECLPDATAGVATIKINIRGSWAVQSIVVGVHFCDSLGDRADSSRIHTRMMRDGQIHFG
jgi:hypothetical protein